MIRFLVRGLILLLAAGVGLLVAVSVVDGMSVDVTSYVLVAALFALVQSILTPFFAKVAHRNAPALLGGVGLITTFVALLVTTVVSDGLTISGAAAWLEATLIVWLVTMVATLIIPIVLVKLGLQAAAERRSSH